MKFVQPIRSRDDIQAMKDALARHGSRDKLLFDLGINTGLRISDIIALRVGDVRNREFVTIKEQKTGKPRRVRLTAVMGEIAAFIRGMDDSRYLFESRKGNEAITRVQAYRILNKAAKECGLEEIGTHTLRKTFGYHHYQQYHDVAMLQRIFNHSSPSITLRYIGIEQDQIDEATADFAL